jgi:hypothetical protein
MAVVHYPGYLTKEEAARKLKVQVRTINIYIRQKRVSFIKVDGIIFVKDTDSHEVPPALVDWKDLQWVRNFAAEHGFTTDRIYEQIIFGKINAVRIANRIFVMRHDEGLLTYAGLAAKSGKKQVFY